MEKLSFKCELVTKVKVEKKLVSNIKLFYLLGVVAAELLVDEKQPTNFGMLVAEVDLIKLLGLGAMYDLERVLVLAVDVRRHILGNYLWFRAWTFAFIKYVQRVLEYP